jgi:hypothetical protein
MPMVVYCRPHSPLGQSASVAQVAGAQWDHAPSATLPTAPEHRHAMPAPQSASVEQV